MRRRLGSQRLTMGLVVTGLVGGLATGAVGGGFERGVAATTLGGLILIIAIVQLVHVWRT